MTITIFDKFRSKVLALLMTTWHCRRESFTVKELELLVGKLGCIAQAYRPFYFLMSHVYLSLAFALQQELSLPCQHFKVLPCTHQKYKAR